MEDFPATNSPFLELFVMFIIKIFFSMNNVKSFNEFINDKSIPSIDEVLKDSITEEKRWERIMKMDFDETSINHEFKVDMSFDNYYVYESSNHSPCVYFRVGESESDFLPMMISDTPYVPYSFEQTIGDEDLYWVSNFVKTNKTNLLKYADGEFGYSSFMSLVNKCENIAEITEDSKRIHPSNTNLSRVIWIGPYGKTGHYLRIKIQHSKGSHNSNEWVALTIPDISKTDISSAELKGFKEFAKGEIDFKKFCEDMKGEKTTNTDQEENHQ